MDQILGDYFQSVEEEVSTQEEDQQQQQHQQQRQSYPGDKFQSPSYQEKRRPPQQITQTNAGLETRIQVLLEMGSTDLCKKILGMNRVQLLKTPKLAVSLCNLFAHYRQGELIQFLTHEVLEIESKDDDSFKRAYPQESDQLMQCYILHHIFREKGSKEAIKECAKIADARTRKNFIEEIEKKRDVQHQRRQKFRRLSVDIEGSNTRRRRGSSFDAQPHSTGPRGSTTTPVPSGIIGRPGLNIDAVKRFLRQKAIASLVFIFLLAILAKRFKNAFNSTLLSALLKKMIGMK